MKEKLKIWIQYLIPQHVFSRLIGRFASIKKPIWFKNWGIKRFIRKYHVNMSEALEPIPEKYASFNEFFTRKLSYHAREIDKDNRYVVSPADGIISEMGDISNDSLIQAKNHHYRLTDLLGGNRQYSSWFENGKFMTIYLSPKDYHRVHMPFEGHLLKQIHVPGKLFSVNPLTVREVPGLFARNERTITLFQTPIGKMAVIFVGAIIVGSIKITAQKDTLLEKGSELGYFQLGSTVIMLFEANKINWLSHLRAESQINMGKKIGELI